MRAMLFRLKPCAESCRSGCSWCAPGSLRPAAAATAAAVWTGTSAHLCTATAGALRVRCSTSMTVHPTGDHQLSQVISMHLHGGGNGVRDMPAHQRCLAHARSCAHFVPVCVHSSRPCVPSRVLRLAGCLGAHWRIDHACPLGPYTLRTARRRCQRGHRAQAQAQQQAQPPTPQEQWQPPLPDEGVKLEVKPEQKVLSEYERFMAEVTPVTPCSVVLCSAASALCCCRPHRACMILTRPPGQGDETRLGSRS